MLVGKYVNVLIYFLKSNLVVVLIKVVTFFVNNRFAVFFSTHFATVISASLKG